MAESATKSRTSPSDEADRKQLELARKQGEAFGNAVKEMAQHEAHGREMRAGDFLVAVAIEHAEGMYHSRDGRLEWQNPTDENAHIEVAVRDAGDGRFVPQLSVRVAVVDAKGREIGSHEQPFLWHPWLYHYGRNWTIPGDGEYTVRVHIDAPSFMRHDKTNGRRYAEPVDVEFAGMKIETGQKCS